MSRSNALQGSRPRANESDPVVPVKFRYDSIIGLSLHKMKLTSGADAWALVAVLESGHEVVIGAPDTSWNNAVDLVNSDYNAYLQQ